MGFIQEWVTQIIIFLLFAMFVELLLPQSTMQKYIKFAVGLILILIFLQPLFQLFNANTAHIFENTLASIDDDGSEQIKNITENEKKEIQASQRAYILNQTVVQLKELAEGELIDKYGVTITDITFSIPESDEEVNWENVEALNVQVKKVENSSGSAVEEVVIDINEDPPEEELPVDEITEDLSSFWEISKEKINLKWEGGEST
jgi:stage III sporulation protein AF